MIFDRRVDGSYFIRNAVPLPLRPDDESATDFFRVRDDILTAQPNYVSTILSTLGQSIVPIVAMVPGENALRCLGTGFFVSATGLMITAAHVIMDPIERNYGGVRPIGDIGWDMSGLNLGVMVATNPLFQQPGWLFRNIEWAGLLARYAENPLPFARRDLRLTCDTAICKVEDPPSDGIYQPLSIIQPGIEGVGLAVGKSAMAIGYGAMRDVELETSSTGLVEGDFGFVLHVAHGRILERFPDNDLKQEVRTPGPCFSASLRLPPGMSGSPIFDDERIYVHGVVSGGLQDRCGPTDLGYGSMLSASMALPIEFLDHKSLIDLISEGVQGMVRLRIAGA